MKKLLAIVAIVLAMFVGGCGGHGHGHHPDFHPGHHGR